MCGMTRREHANGWIQCLVEPLLPLASAVLTISAPRRPDVVDEDVNGAEGFEVGADDLSAPAGGG